jgi:hypothetical protein
MSAKTLPKPNHPKLLLGEGRDEQEFFGAFVRHLNLEKQVQVLPYGGKDKLRPFLKLLVATKGFENVDAVGITRDADVSYAAAVAAVSDAIRDANFPAGVATSYFILPGAKRTGALEDLVLDAIREDKTGAAAWKCVEQFDDCLSGVCAAGAGAENQTSPNVHAKRLVHAWLCSLPVPGLRLGEAAKSGKVNFDVPAFVPLADFCALHCQKSHEVPAPAF